MKTPTSLGLLTLFAAHLFAAETTFTFDVPADAQALAERASGAPTTIYVPSPAGGLGDSGSLQWQSGNRVASRTAEAIRLDGSKNLRLSISFLVFAAEDASGQPLAVGVRSTIEGSPEFGRSAKAENFGFRLGLQGDKTPGNYRLVLVNLPVGGGQQGVGQTVTLAPGSWYRLEVESAPAGPHQIDLVGRLVALNAWGAASSTLDEVSLKGVPNADLLAHANLVPWFGGQSAPLRGIGTVDNFVVSSN